MHTTTLSARRLASFWREKRGSVVISLRRFAKLIVVSKQFKNTVEVLAFFDQQIKKAQLPAIIIIERAILLTKSKINRPGC